MKFDEDDVLRRAWAAYYRFADTSNPDQPSIPISGYEELNGLDYVVLRNHERTLAVYRVTRKDNVLRRLKRWPKELNCRE